jgi:hypothetical protein
MVGDIHYFAWWVPDNGTGFEWQDSDSQLGPVLFCSPKHTLRQYFPLTDVNGLFRQFVETEPTRDGILDFANQFGSLSFNNKWVRFIDEPYAKWKSCILCLRYVVDLWDAARSGDQAKLAAAVQWKLSRSVGTHVIIHVPQDLTNLAQEAGNLRPFDTSCFWMHSLQVGDLIQPALKFVENKLNDFMEGLVSPHLRWDCAGKRPDLQLTPHNLLGAIYLQFALAVDGNKDYRQCPSCGKWFELSTHGARADRLTCSDACRFRAYRQRQERARQMHAEGKTFKEIAKELGSTVATVKGWIAKGKG